MATERPMRDLTPDQRLAAARARACRQMPYFTTGIRELVPRRMDGMGTLGVTANSILMWDPEVLAQWTPSEGGAVLIHEYLHIWLRHAERHAKMVRSGVITDSPDDRKLSNSAADYEINDDLVAAGLPLPKLTASDGSVSSSLVPQNDGLPPNRTYEEYVHLLIKERSKKQGKGSGNQPGQAPNGQPGAGQPPPGAGGGWGQCGSGGGNPLPQEPAPNDPDGRTPLDQKVSNDQTAEAVQQHVANKGKGSVPLGIQLHADECLKPSKIPWPSLLARSAQAAVAYRPGSVDYTRTRPSRRQAAYNAVMDPAPIMPSMHRPLAEVAFVADTSGSMGASLDKILEQGEAVLKAMSGVNVTFIACDAKVHAIKKVRSSKEMRENFKGGGGTDFRPAFAAVAKLTPKPNIIVFATDGEGDYPKEPPVGIHTIWLQIGGHIGVDWGEVIEVDEDTP